MKKILFLTGSRGEWGYIRPILCLLKNYHDVQSILVVTNMHLLPAYGSSYKEIERDGFKINYKIYMSLDGYNHFTQAKSLGICLTSLPDIIAAEKPDWVVLAGDRGEQFMGAIAAAYTYTPVAHIQAGELSGNIDGMTRHAIGKLVHMHFAANKDAAERLIKLGEEAFRVFNVGAPQIDEMVRGKISTLSEIQEKLAVDIENGYILAVMHPVTEEATKAGEQAEIFIKALNNFDLPKVIILPNNDAGSNSIRDVMEVCKEGKYYIHANLHRQDYLGLLKNCKCVVGNSSSGLLEAPTFKIPAVNIGRRQNSRYRGINVIDTDFDLSTIIAAIKKAMSIEFKEHLRNNCSNPYGDGHSSEKIVSLLLNTKVDNKWLVKNITY
ncbi:MAG: UDP-N-acetylglucosamine 2-epimerase [Bacteroidales bacterium]|jgi:GDP/UDP-N,N'-diacetylbacillosamine 2-epimerase (hydrolysing)|nr:UDP-N-acetylglucosamine 2-epimerase [Bacteroidales bacterium]